MKILIVDDEMPARARLQALIEEMDIGDVVGEAPSGKAAIQMCEKFSPDVILLDIRMPGMSGIEAAKHIMQCETPPAIIFTTAYDEYAVSAFEAHAVDYLLKPVRRERLHDALESARKLTRVQIQKVEKSADEPVIRTHISARLGGELRLIPLEDVRYFMAEHKYVTVNYIDGQVLIEDSLKSLEKEFGDRFLRIHRNALVAKNCLLALEKHTGGSSHVRLKDVDVTLEVSRRHLPNVRKLMKQM
jgi:two-component system response regulator AlgR